MFHVHVVCEPYGPVPHTATFVRSLLPLTHPANAAALSVTYGPEYRAADAVLVERVWAADPDAARDLLARARLDRVPVIYATDDNLIDLDPAATRGYVTPARQAAAEYLAREACGVIVSTEPLRERMAEYNRQVVVVPNAVDERLFAGRPPAGRRKDGRLVIGYMGTATHDDDLAMVADALRGVLEAAGGAAEFEVVGGVARAATLDALRGLPVKVLHAGDSTGYPQFMRWLAERIDWDFAVAPLKDTPFNRCKSDLKFLDYGALGVPAVFSNVTPYRESVRDGETGLLADNTPASWRAALRRLAADADLRASLGQNARRHVFARRTLRRCAPRWAAALRALAGRDDGPPRRRAAAKVYVVVPGSVNYFYDRAGHRVADAARTLGLEAEVHTLASLGEREGGCVLLLNPPEAVAGHPDKAEGLERVAALAGRHDRVAAVSLECARTHWFTDLLELCASAGIETVIDVGFVNQYDALPPAARAGYRFVVNGLTGAERRQRKRRPGPGGRPVPWAFVGHHSAQRAELVGRLVREVSPRGFVYLPALSPVAEGGPHVGERAFLTVLRRSDVQVWCSHHDHFYLESERFRMALLAGCVPVKAVPHAPPQPSLLPFGDLVRDVAGLPAFLRSLDLNAAWARFEDEFLGLPSLEEGVAEALAALGVAAPRGRTAASLNGQVSRGRSLTRVG